MKTALLLSLTAALAAGSITPAFADAKVDATLGRLGVACKNKVAAKFPGVPMSDIHVNPSASLQQGLDDGSMGLKDLQQYGATYNWEVPAKKAIGGCNVNAKGKITQFTGK